MERQVLDNGTWFDKEKAECFQEDTYWNGNNHISKVTNSQWNHQELYRTKSGRWVLNSWSQWQGTKETWEEINNEDAAKWLIINGEESHPTCKEEYQALEI